MKAWDEIKKDLIEDENADLVYRILSNINAKEIIFDEDGEEIIRDTIKIARQQLNVIGEYRIANKWT